MPFVADHVQPGQKRRRDSGHGPQVYKLYAADEPSALYVLDQHPELPPRKALPLSKRARIAGSDMHDVASPQCRRRCPSQSRMLPDQATIRPTTTSPVRATSATLAPCHICHRKPTKKSDLDSFAECQGCRQRTCFVCLRHCQGWGVADAEVLEEQEVLERSLCMVDVDDMEAQESMGRGPRTADGWDAGRHRAVVCSRCCIERGAEGDVACLGCLSRIEAA